MGCSGITGLCIVNLCAIHPHPDHGPAYLRSSRHSVKMPIVPLNS
jgi:hypothetical protein